MNMANPQPGVSAERPVTTRVAVWARHNGCDGDSTESHPADDARLVHFVRRRTLARLHPTPDSYVAAYTDSTHAAVDAGFIPQPEADAMIAAARQSKIGRAR